MGASDPALQTRRRANLRRLMQVLEDEGIQSLAAQAGIVAKKSAPQLNALI